MFKFAKIATVILSVTTTTAAFAAEPGAIAATFNAACCALGACCGMPCC